ncbi:MAG: UvrD-helicase domain-containing protein, partial [Desulfobacterales bacterium]
METHPKTGAAQIVELREKIKKITIPQYVETTGPSSAKPPLFSKITEEELLRYGIPSDWISEVKRANEDTLFDLADHLPQEATEALLDLAVGVKPKMPDEHIRYEDPLDHPDAQRRFRVMKNIEELKSALEYPWEKWCIFLHPEQRQIVEKDYSGPARVSGSAGTGKTIVAIHRAVYLARNNPNARVLLATFSEALANSLKTKLRRLIRSEPHIGERLEVYDMNTLGRRLYELNFDRPNIASQDIIRELIAEAAAEFTENRFSLHFLITEWEEVIDAWQLTTWEEYKDVKRLGRKMRLPEKQRQMLWSIFERVKQKLEARKLITFPEIFSRLASQISKSGCPPFDFAVVDEAQDISIPQLRFLSALGGERRNGLFFAGDLGQRIFQQPFSWKSLGVNIRGRSSTLKINYRTTHQIRIQADRLLAPEVSDVDGNTEDRRGTISLFNGPK